MPAEGGPGARASFSLIIPFTVYAFLRSIDYNSDGNYTSEENLSDRRIFLKWVCRNNE